MIIRPIHTRIMQPPQDDLLETIKASLPAIQEKSIVAITSKVVAIWQGKCVPISGTEDQKDLISKQEAEHYIDRDAVVGWPVLRTIKQGILAVSAGVDASNADGYLIALPDSPHKTAKKLWQWLRDTYKVTDVGVIVTDSRSIPLRRGSVGISYGFYGFRPINDYRTSQDIFGNELKISMANVADGLAAAAVVAMGEGDEITPLALIEDVAGRIEFSDVPYAPTDPLETFYVEQKDDMYFPYLKDQPWKKGGSTHEDI